MKTEEAIAFEQFQNSLYDMFYVEESVNPRVITEKLLIELFRRVSLVRVAELMGLSIFDLRELMKTYDLSHIKEVAVE